MVPYRLMYALGLVPWERRDFGAGAGLTELAAPGARLLLLAFKAARRLLLPRGMGREHVVALLEEGWELEDARSVVGEDMPPPVRRAQPAIYRLSRRP